MNTGASILTVMLVVLLFIAAVYDCYRHKIPNVISLGGWLVAPLLHAATGGVDGLVDSVTGLFLALLLTFPLFALRWMGAGDVKLMTAVGAFVGSKSVLPVLGLIFISGAVFAVLAYLYRGSLRETLQRLVTMLSMSLSMRRPVYIPAKESAAEILIPYAVPIATGTLIFVYL